MCLNVDLSRESRKWGFKTALEPYHGVGNIEKRI